jgi:MFS family permease
VSFSRASSCLVLVLYYVVLLGCVFNQRSPPRGNIFQDLEWLIAARALSGVGGGGIVSSVWVITTEIVEVRKRAKWSQALSVTWSCSAVAGPVLGGIFSSKHNFSI